AAAANLRDALRLLADDATEPDEAAPTPSPTTSVTPSTGGGPPPDAGNAPVDESDEGPEPDGPPPQPSGLDETAVVDADGNPVPERLKPIFACRPQLVLAARRAEGLANLYQQVEQTPAYGKAFEGTKHRDHSTFIRAAGRAIKAITPERP